MSRLFISHSSHNDDWAIALRDWLVREGWSGEDDIFLDLDPARGIAAGQRWADALQDAATRCEAVLFLVSDAWLASKWCHDEYQLANKYNKKLFALLIEDIALDRLPGGLTAQWQIVRLPGEPAERFVTVHPRTRRQSPVHVAEGALASLRRGLQKAGIGAETFDLQRDAAEPSGWRAVYRGLEALEPEDAAVFFGRNADIVRGIDVLRGLAARRSRLLVVLGASGAGKSSFLRAGLWPRLLRDDSQWLPLRPIRAGRGGAIEGSEGYLAALEEAHRRFGLSASRAELRKSLATPEAFVAVLHTLRRAAARRTLIAEPPFPLPLLCLDQAEELFAADAGVQSATLLALARAAVETDEALLLFTIRSDAYGLMQSAPVLAGIAQQPFSLGPVPQGEIGRVIRKPAELLRRRAGPAVPVFNAALVARLQDEIVGEADALPLLAFVLQRLMREHASVGTIGLAELEATGGVAAVIESEAEAALADAGFAPDRAERRDALRRLFIPRLARIDRASKAPQRRMSVQGDLPGELLPLARALTQRRLLVAKLASQGEGTAEAATLEVAHEALLRRWPTLAELLAEDRDALLLLDSVLNAAMDWAKTGEAQKGDYLAHRGSRLADAQALAARGADWEREIVRARAYLAACAARDARDQEEREAALAREAMRLEEVAAGQARQAALQRRARWALIATAVVVLIASALLAVKNGEVADQALLVTNGRLALQHNRASLLGEVAGAQRRAGNLVGALRFSTMGTAMDRALPSGVAGISPVAAELAASVVASHWRTSLAGHLGAVRSATVSSNGARIVTASSDRTARVWDAATGKEIIVLRGHENGVSSAAFSPDGARIVTASSDRTARVWDAATGKEIIVLRGHENGVSSAAFSPDGARIVTASDDGTARIWDAATGKEITVLREHENGVSSAAFSPDGTRIVTASGDFSARVWDAATGKEITILRGHDGPVSSAAFSPDGAQIVTASDDSTARLWDAATGIEISVLRGHEGLVLSAAFSPDGARIVTASSDRTARVWDAATGKEIIVLRGHENGVSSAAFSPDGARIVTASDDGTARIWDAAPCDPITTLRGHENSASFAAFSPDGARIVTASNDGTARIWDATKGNEIVVLRGHEANLGYATFSPDGARIVTASDDGTARIWDVAKGRELTVLRGHKDFVYSAVFSPDGARIVTASKDETARIWDAATGKEISVLHGHNGPVFSATFSHDGARIVTASSDDTARVWDATTGKEIIVLRGSKLNVKDAAFSPDSARIATASGDGAARIWDAATGKEITVLHGHNGPVFSATFSPDGARIITVSGDMTARVWDAATGKEITVLCGHKEDRGDSVAFSPDGARIVTASEEGARIWDVHFATMPPDKLLGEACMHRLRGISTMTRDEMRLVGYPDNQPPIDVCAGIR